MINTIKLCILSGLLVYDFGAIIPWIISTNQMPIYIQIVLVILHLIVYGFLGKFIFIKLKKFYEDFKKLID